MNSFESKINALTVRQLIYVAVVLAAIILAIQYRSQIQAALEK
jgi:hypothetical protein